MRKKITIMSLKVKIMSWMLTFDLIIKIYIFIHFNWRVFFSPLISNNHFKYCWSVFVVVVVVLFLSLLLGPYRKYGGNKTRQLLLQLAVRRKEKIISEYYSRGKVPWGRLRAPENMIYVLRAPHSSSACQDAVFCEGILQHPHTGHGVYHPSHSPSRATQRETEWEAGRQTGWRRITPRNDSLRPDTITRHGVMLLLLLLLFFSSFFLLSSLLLLLLFSAYS